MLVCWRPLPLEGLTTSPRVRATKDDSDTVGKRGRINDLSSPLNHSILMLMTCARSTDGDVTVRVWCPSCATRGSPVNGMQVVQNLLTTHPLTTRSRSRASRRNAVHHLPR